MTRDLPALYGILFAFFAMTESLPAKAEENSLATEGFVAGSSLTVLVRNYAERLTYGEKPARSAWVAGARAAYASGYTQGQLGVGLDFEPFAAVRLGSNGEPGNMVHLESDGSGQREDAWAYLGAYALKLRSPAGLLKYGLLEMQDDEYLQPYDIRALPPTYRGFSFEGNCSNGWRCIAGNFNGVITRGATRVSSLTTTMGASAFRRFTYAGVEFDNGDNRSFQHGAVYVSHAYEMWDQVYASWSFLQGTAESIKLGIHTDVYLTRSDGLGRQGSISNRAQSLALSAQHGVAAVTFGYQQIFGDQFFDYIQETSGIQLANSAAVDYNAPHERSFQARFKLGGESIGLPGGFISTHYVYGGSVNATAGAILHAASSDALHGLYWVEGQPVGGNHHEYGFDIGYKKPSRARDEWSWKITCITHVAQANYSDKSFHIARLILNFPISIF